MIKTVQVRPMTSASTEAPTRNQPFDNGRSTDKQTPYLLKLLMGLCIGQLITMTATAAVLGSFVNSHMTDRHNQGKKPLRRKIASLQSVNEKVLKLKSEHEFDRNLVKELKASVRLIEDNVTTHAVILQNYSSHLNEFDHEMTIINETIILQHNNHEQLKEKMTDHRRGSFSFNNRLNELEARTNNSELSLVDHDNRLRQVELRHISEIVLNEEQETQIRVLGEEMNKTWIAIQGFGEGSRDPTVNGGWSTWSTWSLCTKTCNTGQKERQKTCTNPAPLGMGRTCSGNSEALTICNNNPCPAYQSAFAIYGWKPTYNSATGVAIFPDNAVKLNLGTDYSPTTGQFTCRYAGVYVFVLNLYRWKKDGSRVMCFIRINGRDIAYANAPAYSEYGWNGGSGSTVVHLDQGDAVDAGTCDGGDNVSGSMSFMGFLLQAD